MNLNQRTVNSIGQINVPLGLEELQEMNVQQFPRWRHLKHEKMQQCSDAVLALPGFEEDAVGITGMATVALKLCNIQELYLYCGLHTKLDFGKSGVYLSRDMSLAHALGFGDVNESVAPAGKEKCPVKDLAWGENCVTAMKQSLELQTLHTDTLSCTQELHGMSPALSVQFVHPRKDQKHLSLVSYELEVKLPPCLEVQESFFTCRPLHLSSGAMASTADEREQQPQPRLGAVGRTGKLSCHLLFAAQCWERQGKPMTGSKGEGTRERTKNSSCCNGSVVLERPRGIFQEMTGTTLWFPLLLPMEMLPDECCPGVNTSGGGPSQRYQRTSRLCEAYREVRVTLTQALSHNAQKVSISMGNAFVIALAQPWRQSLTAVSKTANSLVVKNSCSDLVALGTSAEKQQGGFLKESKSPVYLEQNNEKYLWFLERECVMTSFNVSGGEWNIQQKAKEMEYRL
ncbi:hypothetical protein BTVI_107450 [Pitangus sulphuratus]|nr:hypothetical protein BTVI_107450 [Pitangus sulphuratus]